MSADDVSADGVDEVGEAGAIIAEVMAEMAAEDIRRAVAISAANTAAADLIARRLPCRVRVVAHAEDTYRPCDVGREGWVRTAPNEPVRGAWWVYVEDLGPGDEHDRNPTRYHETRHLAVLADDRPRQ